jgi:DNA-directed RNA polymerase subunit RPC12/RpoP
VDRTASSARGDRLYASDPPDGPTSSEDAPVAGLRRESGCLMLYVNREWNCRNCGRSNRSEVAPDGTVKCEYCARVMKIQPSRARGGEVPNQYSRFVPRLV